MKKKAFLAIFTCALIAGTGGLIVKGMPSLTPSAIAWYRTAIPSIILGVWVLLTGRNLFRGNNKTMLFASAINALRMYFFVMAFVYTSIGNAVILLYTWPIFVALFSSIYLKERISQKQQLLLALAFAGLVISYSQKTFSFEDKDMIGMLAALGSAFFYAITVVIYKKESDNYHRLELILYQNLIGAFVFLPSMMYNFPEATAADLGVALIYALVIGIGTFSLFFYALKYLNASTVSSMMYLEVISAIALGSLFHNEQLSMTMIIGGVMILAASFMTNRIRSAEG